MDATRFVEELLSLGGVTREQIDVAAQDTSSWRTLPARLVDRGCDRGDVLAAVSAAVGLPPAPLSVFRAAVFAQQTNVQVSVWRSMNACPVVAADGVVLLVTDHDGVTAAQASGVTPARVYVALEQDISDVLASAEAASANAGVVVHEAMDQVGLASAESDVLGLPGAPVGWASTAVSLDLDLSDRRASAPSFGGVEGTPVTATQPMPSPFSGPDSSSGGGIAALTDDGDDSALEKAAGGGERLCGYDIFEELGRGASAVVFRARRPGDDVDVALKVITKETARNPSFPQRFKREIRAQASLTHRNIVRVLDYGREDGWYYLATEYLPGGTLEDLFEQTGALPPHIAVCLLDDVLRGIAFAQQRGVVHRDLKPGNLLLASDGGIKIGDFGLARMDLDPNKSSLGAVQGTPAYMSPEQALGLDIDGRSDFFTLATILYELVTGRNPYRRDHGPATLMAVAQAKPLSLFDAVPGVPLALDEAVYRMSHKELERRPASAEELLDLIAPVVDSVTRRWPGLLLTYFQSPVETRARLSLEVADDEVALAKAALADGDEKLRPRAAVAAARALSLRQDHPEARALFDQLAATGGFTLGTAQKPDLIAVEQQLEDATEDSRLLRRASELARGEGNIIKQAAYLRRYLRLGQKDTLAVHQLSLLLPGDDVRPPATSSPGTRIATPATSPVVAPAFSGFTPPSGTPQLAASHPSAPPVAAAPAQAQGIPSSRAPRVVGTGADHPAMKETRGRGTTAFVLLGVGFFVIAAVGAWFFFKGELSALISDVAEEQVDGRHDDDVPKVAVASSPFDKRQRAALAEARAHVDGGRLDEALAAYTRAIDINPGSPMATEGRLGRADAYLKKGDSAAGVREYRRVRRLTSTGVFGYAEAEAALKALGQPLEGDAE